ncbi:hypothetical protein Thena_0047 [Thermodesulfobium narugense DSM 14796]|uniref:Uncharacterized protein n=1 Tax=Thermodesulfobium narugense DSM 14796 TaxID=747365 RepID=M1E6Q6_9BACT|nr:hypothetical protein [Thermodesulfobium narugense]AEE13699.1 hypothetical protein Thena_0047 [Thermodesulfobium narugense DSM 14796]
MKRFTFIFLILTLLAFTNTSYAEFSFNNISQSDFLLKQGETNLVLPGEYFEIKINEKDNSNFSIDYDKSLVELTREESLPDSKIYYFKVISDKTSYTKIVAKSNKENLKPLTYDVYISTPHDIPLVTIKDIHDNPEKFVNKFVRLNARFLGWSRPTNTNDIWGALVTKSDTVIEDNTGAAFISGTNFMYKTDSAVSFIAKVKPDEKAGFEIRLVKLLK